MISEPESEDRQLEDLHAQMQELQRHLLQAQKMSSVGALASSITHEFNNILTTVINYAKMGIRNKDEANRDKCFDKILGAAERAAKLTHGMLSYARQRKLDLEATNLRRLVEDVLTLVEKDLSIHRVRLQVDYGDEPWAMTNPSQVQQVLLNLIINARQAMTGGGSLEIIIRTHPTEPFAEISIQDTGIGIPAARLPHIFDPFYTTKTADAQGQGGTGLGLALCREIMEAHQGRIRVESAPGRGTRFTLRFPVIARPVVAT